MIELISEIKKKHRWSPARSSESDFEEIEKRYSCNLPEDMMQFYTVFENVELFDGKYLLLPLQEMNYVGSLQAGEFGRLACSPSWIAICDCMDGDYVGVDTEPQTIIDCNHEDLGTVRVIASRFSDFLKLVLSTGPSPYWLELDFTPSRILEFEPSPEFYRIADEAFWLQLGEEVDPEPCSCTGCERKRISLSTMCRRHHYEMVMNRSCPFDD